LLRYGAATPESRPSGEVLISVANRRNSRLSIGLFYPPVLFSKVSRERRMTARPSLCATLLRHDLVGA
jgi:hypothetical protein